MKSIKTSVLDTIKQKNAELIKYNGIQELYVNSNSGSRLYDENDCHYRSLKGRIVLCTSL